MTNFESRLRDAMVASVAAVEPTFTAADVMRRHDHRVRRLTAMCLAVAVAMGAVAFLLPRQLGRVSAAVMTIEPLAGHTTSYIDPGYGWSITYNRALVEGRSTATARLGVVEAVRFTNFRPKMYGYGSRSGSRSGAGSGAGKLPTSWLHSFPASGVALQIWNVAAAVEHPRAREMALPLQLARFTPASRFTGGSEPIPKVQVFFDDGVQFKAAVWIGRLASTASTHAIWAAVRSIRFPPLPSGTTWQHRFYLLGLPSTHRLQSVTFPLDKPADLPNNHRGPGQCCQKQRDRPALGGWASREDGVSDSGGTARGAAA